MATEINSASVLAKLMGIKTPSLSHPQGRQKILSENYFENIAFITHRKRTSMDEFTYLVGGSDNVAQSVHVKTTLEGAMYLCQDQRSEQFEGFDPQDNASLCSELSCLSNLCSSPASKIKRQKSSEVRIWQKKSRQCMETSHFTQNVSKDCLRVANGCSPSERIIELNMQNSRSPLLGRSSLPNCTTGGRKQNISCGRDKGISFRGKKMRNLDNAVESPVEDCRSSWEIAKQLASEVKHSMWHRFTDVSNSGPRDDKNSVSEHEETMSSFSCLSSLDNEHGTSSSKPIKKSASQDVQKITKEISERWKTRKSDQEGRTFRGNSDGMHCRTPFTANANGWPVGAARYLSKPTLFPSAWVPRSRVRDLDLDSRWCLRPEKPENLQCDNLGDNLGHEILRSTLEPSGVDLSSGEYDMREALRILNDSKTFKESNMSEVSSPPEYSSESSLLPYIESPTYLEALMTLSEADDMNMENHVSQEGSFRPLLNCTIVPSSMDNERISDEGNRKEGTHVKLQREKLSAEATTCISLEDRGSSFPELCLKHQVKENSSEPVSPVSSLEGPEACRCRPKPIVEYKQISSIPEFLENNIHGFQRKLQPIDTMSSESGSEGPEMVVSTDGDNEGNSPVGCYREDAQIMELYGTLENRDFSYVVDVLSELGFPTLNLETESEAWRCQGYALNPLVFDSLEKKYGKQTFWERSERKLLFDRMDLGLLEIARSLDLMITLRKPLSKRFGSMQNQELIEEEVWALLVKQEEESKRASCSKVCGGEMEWLEIETYTYWIVKEVESLLLDELAEEFVSMATCF